MLVLPGYQTIEKIYENAISRIYRGKRIQDKQPVILKTPTSLHPTPEQIARYKLEYEITHKLNLKGVVRAYALENYQNSLVMILEDFGSLSLKALINSRKISLQKYLQIAIQLVDIISGIHAVNIIHKDINPSNIVIQPATGQVKIIDFGIATFLSRENPTILTTGTLNTGNRHILEGTLAYMSPEQTGRMNRTLDYRTDFYSLGVTFYELLTQQLPFDTTDAMELVHCHIAKQPVPPHELNPNIPKTVSDIVLKLLSKAAEDRYQSAWGLKLDLESCLNQIETCGRVETFPIGKHDVSEKFQIPQKLYGREQEIQILLTAFDRVSQGKSAMMLVSGYSGIGKSALVQEIYKPITRERGYFTTGKFDQFQRNIPYSSIIQALQSLIRQLLTESEAQIEIWREQILTALGANAQIIIDVIPEVELILGRQMAVPELAPTEAQNRFNIVFQNFICVFAKAEHPLVIFLDDLQWADSASLKLIQLLITATDTKYLFLLGAYRDNEVAETHPLMLTLDEIRKEETIVNHVSLAPLPLTYIKQLIADTLNCGLEKAKLLAELVLQKTHGNPFFINEFLKNLYTENLLKFEPHQGTWRWDLAQIQELEITDNVVDLLAGKILALPKSAQQILKVAACIGNQFNLKTLSIVHEKSQSETARQLWEAVQSGLIMPIGNMVTDELSLSPVASVSRDNSSVISVTSFATKSYKFLHDKVQQAAYSLMATREKQVVHLQVGQLLLKSTPQESREEIIFDIVNQLNFGTQLITNQADRKELANLNFIAGKKALVSAAYEPALTYLNVGIGLLSVDSWNDCYELTLKLYVAAAKAAYLNTDFEQMERLAEIVVQKARMLLDAVKVYEVKIQAYQAQNKFQEAVNTALQVLKLLGVTLPENPSKLHISRSLLETKSTLGVNQIEELIDLPPMTDPHKLAAMRILSSVVLVTFYAFPQLMPLVVLKQVNLSVKYGNASMSAFAYSWYGLILCGVVGDIESGYEFGKLALSLLERLNANELKVRTYFTVNCFIKPWKLPAKETLKPLMDGYQMGLETGDLEYAAFSAFVHSAYSYMIGKELTALEAEMALYSEVMKQLKQETFLHQYALYRQVVLNLMGKAENPCRLIGEAYDEEQMIQLHIEANDQNAIGDIYLETFILCYLFEDFQQAFEKAAIAQKYLDSTAATLVVPLFYLYDSLTKLAVYANADNAEQKRLLRQVQSNQKKMKTWAHHAPANFLHKFYLVKAEVHRVKNQDSQAIEYYDRAIKLAQENEYLNEEALANELAAKFYLAKGKNTIASAYMLDARSCYLRWGATAKVRDLDTRYPFTRNTEVTSAETSQTNLTSIGSGNIFDFTTIMKASQALSGEIVLDKLLAKLMKILIQNAGAQKGLLILARDGKLLIEAEALVEQDEVAVQQSIIVESSHNLPVTVIHYVERTGDDVVLSHAALEERFTSDPYIALNKLKSVLCTPIINQGKLIAILYLENNLTIGAFTPDRLEILKLLSSQVAISLENALLYSSMEHKVQERTQELNEKNVYLEQTLHELKRTQAQLIQTEKMASLGKIVAGVAHEINNPISFIYGNLTPASEYVANLLALLHIYQEEYPNPTPKIQETTEDIDLEFMVEDLQKILGSMKLGADRIRNIVLSLRNFSRLDEADKKLVDIDSGIESTLLILQNRLRKEAGRPQIEVIKEYATLPKVKCYVSQLNQVFMYILSNAIDALEATRGKGQESDTKPTITIRTEVTAADSVTIRIADNGSGIPQDVLPKIFDPFFTTKPVGGGIGLGLSISHHVVVEKHGGQLTCISALGEGTELVIEIPLKQKN